MNGNGLIGAELFQRVWCGAITGTKPSGCAEDAI